MSSRYTGFPTVEGFAGQARRESRVNVAAITEAGRFGKHGLCTVNSAVMVSQWDGNELLYCRVTVSRFSSLDGHTPLGSGRDHAALARQAYHITVRWLTEQGFMVCNAVAAVPRNLKFLEGHAGFLHYTEAEGYTRRAVPEAGR